MKKAISFLLSILIVVSIPVLSYGAFIDLDDVYYENCYKILWCQDMGLMNGTTPKAYSPNNGFTKAMAVTVLYRFYDRLGIDNAAENTVDSIKDVSINAYYNEAALWAVSNGIISLTSGGMMEPSKVITIKEFMEMLYNFHRSFSKAGVTDNIGDAMDWANENNLLTELEDSKAKTSVTREMAAVVFYRYDDINHPKPININIDDVEYIDILYITAYDVKKVKVSKDIYSKILDKLNSFDYVKKVLNMVDGNGSGFGIYMKDGTRQSIGYEEGKNYLPLSYGEYYWDSDEVVIDKSWFEEIFYYKDNVSPPYD